MAKAAIQLGEWGVGSEFEQGRRIQTMRTRPKMTGQIRRQFNNQRTDEYNNKDNEKDGWTGRVGRSGGRKEAAAAAAAAGAIHGRPRKTESQPTTFRTYVERPRARFASTRDVEMYRHHAAP